MTTPLGKPVVPPVYMRTARSSSSGSGGSAGRARRHQILVGQVVRDVAAADQDHLVDTGLRPDAVHQGGEEGVGETDPAGGVLDDKRQLLRGEAQVERVDHAPAQEAGVVELQKLVAVEGHDREAVTPAQAELTGHAIDQPADPVPVLGEGGAEPAVHHRGLRGQPLDRREQQAVVYQLLHPPDHRAGDRSRSASGSSPSGQDRRTTKYLAWGWWQTMAAVVCSGWNCQEVSSLTSTLMRSAPTSSAHLALSSRSGHAS